MIISFSGCVNKNKEAYEISKIAYMNDDGLYDFCISLVLNAYDMNGDFEKAKKAIEAAKIQMKQLSNEYSDYEHYPNLKGYFTTTSSMLDFCKNLNCSFEQLQDILNDYSKEARDYVSDLNYIFEE